MAKLSLFLLYLDIFRPNIRLRYAIYIGTAVVSMFYIATFVAFAVFSIPRPGKSELAHILSPSISKDITLGLIQGGFSVATDFYILCLPIPVVWNLQLPMKKKIGILAIFMTGLLWDIQCTFGSSAIHADLCNSACIASTVSLYYRAKMGRHDDVTWKLVSVLLWV